MFGTVHEAGRVFNGQYLYVVADLATIRIPATRDSSRFSFPARFLDSVTGYAARLGTRKGAPAAIWGASSKGVIFSLFMARAGTAADMVIDVNPAKQSRFLPVTGLQVQSPGSAMKLLPPGAEIFVMNGNYLEEVRASTGNRFNYTTLDHDGIAEAKYPR